MQITLWCNNLSWAWYLTFILLIDTIITPHTIARRIYKLYPAHELEQTLYSAANSMLQQGNCAWSNSTSPHQHMCYIIFTHHGLCVAQCTKKVTQPPLASDWLGIGSSHVHFLIP